MAEIIPGQNINNANTSSTPQNKAKTPTIVAAGMLRQLDINLLKAVQSYFAMEADSTESAASITESVTGILEAAKNLNGSDSLDSEITPDTICCFNASGQMLCTLLSFEENSYKLLLPAELKSNAAYLSPAERVKLLSQLTYYKDPQNNGIAELEWIELVRPQMLSVLSDHDITHANQDTERELRHRLYAKQSFRKGHGANGKVALFGFNFAEPLICLSTSSFPKEDYNYKTKLTTSFVTEKVKSAKTQNLTHKFDNSAQPESEAPPQTLKASITLEQSRCRMESSERGTLSSTSSSSILLEGSTPDINDLDLGGDAFTSPKITFDNNFGFRIASRVEEGINGTGGSCTICNENVSADQLLSCYLCKLSVHFTCYKVNQGTAHKPKMRALSRSNFTALGISQNNKWFCNGCNSVSFDDILEKISLHTQEKFIDAVEEKIKLLNDTTSSSIEEDLDVTQSSLPDYQGMKSQESEQEITNIQQLKDSITMELRAALKEEIKTLVSAITLPHNTTQSKLNTMSASYADKAASPHSHLSNNTFKNPQMVKEFINKPASAVGTDYLVDPKMSVIIKQVTNKKVVSNDTSLKSEFNKLFNQMKIKYIKKTRYGNIILQLNSEDDIKQVLSGWQSHYFKDAKAKMGTEIFRMTDQHLTKYVGIIKHVPINIDMSSISNGLENANLNSTHVTRLGKSSNSVKVIFKSHEDLTQAISKGFGLEHLWLEVAQFKFTKKPMQCHGCKRFGHPVKWCRSKAACGFCSSENHTDKECLERTHPSKFCCRNCRGNHTAFSNLCPHFIEKMNLIKQSSHHDY